MAKLFAAAIEKVFPGQGLAPIISPCNNPKFGDYQCNNAMPLFATFKGKEDAPFKNPREIATAILDALPESPLISETSIAGPGFINARVSTEWLSKELQGLLRNGSSSWAPPLPQGREKVIVDFSSPNIAKEMHVGHLRSTIIGDTICRLLEFSGAHVLRLNHVGDWGTQFGMLIEFLKEETGGSPENASKAVGDLQAFYKKAKAKFDEDEDFKLRAQKAVVKLQGGDPESLALWRGICDVSRREFDSLYKRLGVELEERGESFYNALIPDVLAELEENKVSILSDGAMCVFPKGKDGEIDTDGTPLIVQKSDGGFNYASTDLTAIKQRLFTENADWIIYVTDVGQQSHFKMVFETAERAGWLEAGARAGRGAPRIDHVGFGLVLGEDGKRFRTRSGEVVRLVDLLDEAKKRCLAQLEERGRGEELDTAELAHAAEAMGYGAVKYADLHSNRTSNYTFSFDRMLDLKGNTAVYLLYAHARIASIVRKADRNIEGLADSTCITLEHPMELQLAKSLSAFPEAVEDALDELAPNRLCDYLYDLSSKFTEFYGECKVIGSEEEESRLMLCEATAMIMRQCFQILGITPLMRI